MEVRDELVEQNAHADVGTFIKCPHLKVICYLRLGYNFWIKFILEIDTLRP